MYYTVLINCLVFKITQKYFCSRTIIINLSFFIILFLVLYKKFGIISFIFGAVFLSIQIYILKNIITCRVAS